MGQSNLNRTGEQAPVINKGHGTRALGPSDRSDTGSDVQGGPGLSPELEPDHPPPGYDGDELRNTAGPDLGDSDLDSDTDSGGTGERASAGRDSTVPDAKDIQPDHVEQVKARWLAH